VAQWAAGPTRLRNAAAGHGADKMHALLNLWEGLKQNGAVAEAIDYVATEYRRRAVRAARESTD